MVLTNKTIFISKRNFDSKIKKNKANISSRKFIAREEFKFVEYARADRDSKTKYVLIAPISNKRDPNCNLLFNLNSLKSHFYIKCA